MKSFFDAPAFASLSGGDFHLSSSSPCINTGDNAAVLGNTDLNGRPRIVGTAVDMGVYEFQGVGMAGFIAWLQQYGLAVDGSVDFFDVDGDGLNNWQEYQARTNPTNALSVLKFGSPTRDASGVTVTWQSVNGLAYYLERGTNLATSPALFPLQSNLVGQANSTSFTDTTATNAGSYFYRVGIQ